MSACSKEEVFDINQCLTEIENGLNQHINCANSSFANTSFEYLGDISFTNTAKEYFADFCFNEGDVVEFKDSSNNTLALSVNIKTYRRTTSQYSITDSANPDNKIKYCFDTEDAVLKLSSETINLELNLRAFIDPAVSTDIYYAFTIKSEINGVRRTVFRTVVDYLINPVEEFDKVIFYDKITLNGQEYLNVKSYNAATIHASFETIFYNAEQGLIAIQEANQNLWVKR